MWAFIFGPVFRTSNVKHQQTGLVYFYLNPFLQLSRPAACRPNNCDSLAHS